MQQRKAKEAKAAAASASASASNAATPTPPAGAGAAAAGTARKELSGIESTIHTTEADLDATVAALATEMDTDEPPAKRPHQGPTA